MILPRIVWGTIENIPQNCPLKEKTGKHLSKGPILPMDMVFYPCDFSGLYRSTNADHIPVGNSHNTESLE
jgi:hypothetical protein